MSEQRRQVRTSAGVVAPWLVAAVTLGLAVRLAFGLAYWTGKPLTQDEREYLDLARNVAAGHGFAYSPLPPDRPPRRQFSRAPLYPAFLAGVILVADPAAPDREMPAETPRPVKVAQAVIGAVVVVLIGLIAARAAGRAAGAVAASIAAVYPPLVWMPAYALSETLYGALALGAVVLAAPAIEEGTPPSGSARTFAAGVVTGLATLTRPAMLVFLLLAAAWLARKHRLAAAALIVAGAAVVVAPWTARNLAVHGRLVLVAAEGGVTFWTGNHPLALGEGDMAANPAIKRDFLRVEAAHPELSNEALEGIYYREALGYIIDRPVAWARLVVRKAFFTVVPVGPSYRLHSTRYFVMSLLSYGLLLPIGVAGIVRLRRAPAAPSALWLLAASAVAVCLAFFPQERFRIPVIDPTLIVGAAAVLSTRTLGRNGNQQSGIGARATRPSPVEGAGS